MVSYPYALDNEGRVIPVRQAMSGAMYSCLACKERLVPRHGLQVEWHYYHYVSGDCTSSESSLHRIAKRLIIAGVESARRAKTIYNAELTCTTCSTVIGRAEIKGVSHYALDEHYLTPKLRPDISFLAIDSGEPFGTVEVVVSSPPSPDALAEYQREKIWCLIVKPTWDTVWTLRNGIRTNEGINIDVKCSKCANTLGFTGKRWYPGTGNYRKRWRRRRPRS